MAKIKLLKLDELSDGTIRLQSQLMVGRDTADFILKDGVLKCWGASEFGNFNFHEYTEPYEIVETKQYILRQEL
jgi:hypothetical protein